MAYTPVNTFALFYARSVGLSMQAYGTSLAAGLLFSLVFSPFIGALADRVHPLRIGLGSLAVYLPLCVWGSRWIVSPGSFAVAFVAHVVISGVFATGTASAGQRLFPKAKFAQFASAAQLILGLFTILLPSLIGMVLDFSGHAYGLTFLAGGILCALSLASFVVVLRFYHRLGGDTAYRPPERPEDQKIA